MTSFLPHPRSSTQDYALTSSLWFPAHNPGVDGQRQPSSVSTCLQRQTFMTHWASIFPQLQYLGITEEWYPTSGPPCPTPGIFKSIPYGKLNITNFCHILAATANNSFNTPNGCPVHWQGWCTLWNWRQEGFFLLLSCSLSLNGLWGLSGLAQCWRLRRQRRHWTSRRRLVLDFQLLDVITAIFLL